MRIIPVLDLMAGRVVRGVAGRRDGYRPVVSRLASDADPASIGRAFRDRLGLTELYVADLDAIGGGDPAWTCYAELLAEGLDLWVDAGLRDANDARALAGFRAGGGTHDGAPGGAFRGIIAGLETVPSPEALAAMVDVVGTERLVFSLDLKAGRPLSEAEAWRDKTPLEIATLAVDAGARRMILLDLARVGVGEGAGTEGLCRAVREAHPELRIIAGGGVRGADDLRALADAGCNAALVASALHDGRIGRADVRVMSDE